MPYTGLQGFSELPIKVATGLYTTSIGGFGYLSCQDWTGRTYAGIGINEASLKKKGIMPNSKCLVKPVDCISRTIRPAYMDYPAIVIPLSRKNYPGELELSPNGEAVLPYWFSENGQGRLNFQAEAGDQIILSFGLFERQDTFSGLIENPLWPENNRLSVI